MISDIQPIDIIYSEFENHPTYLTHLQVMKIFRM